MEQLDQYDNNTVSFWDRFWHRIAILNLTDDEKTEVAKKMVDYSYTDALYWLQLILSVIIATLGLLINSSPVVIGAMLISPILQPIQSFAFAVNSGHKSMYIRSLHNLIFSVIVSIIVAVFITWMIPFASITSQVIARTTPTLLDLFIALSGGIIAMLALGYTRLSDTLAGVAMAASLLPPLCVIGIGIAFFRRDIAEGSLLLFLANLVALVLVGLLILYLFGFFPTNKDSQKLSFSRFFMIVITVLFVTVPLWTSMHAIAQDYRITQTITSLSHDYLSSIHPQVVIAQVGYEDRQGVIRITLFLQMPESVRFTADDRAKLTRRLFDALGQSVELDIQIVYVAGAYVKTLDKPLSEKELSIRDHFSLLFPGSLLHSSSLSETDDHVLVDLYFVTDMSSEDTSAYLEAWKVILEKYWGVSVSLQAQVSYIDILVF